MYGEHNPTPATQSDERGSSLSTNQEKTISSLVRGIVSHPESVRVYSTYHGHKEVVVVEVHPDDRPLVIGRKGRHAEALRTVMRVLGHDVRIEIC